MASLTAASLSVPSFCGLRALEVATKASSPCPVVPFAPIRASSALSTSASLPDFVSKAASSALVAATASILLASPALAVKVEVGDEVGNFKFYPDSITVAAGEPIVFTLVGETGHNIVFDIPAGTPDPVAQELAAASMGENDLLTEDENTFTAKISTPGSYSFYCTPHKSANMKGSIVVK